MIDDFTKACWDAAAWWCGVRPFAASTAAVAALAAILLFAPDDSEARPYSVETAKDGAALFAAPSPRSGPHMINIAFDHSATLTGQPGLQGGSLQGLFNRRGLVGGFAAGFLGAGLLGLVFGPGLFGELGSVASYLGLAFQLVLIAMFCRLLWTWRSGRHAPSFAGLSPRQLADPYLRSRTGLPAGVESLESPPREAAEHREHS